jgi:hypothetical protein
MKTLNIAGTMKSVSFYEDDTIETIRNLIGLELNMHPDRLFLEIRQSFPQNYYSSNPKNWSDLFFRMSYDGKTIQPDVMKTYLTQIRLNTGMVEKQVTKEEWEDHDEYLQAIYNPDSDFDEWRVFGVETPFIMALPPKDLPMSGTQIPVPKVHSLYDTIYKSDTIEIRATPVEDAFSEVTKRNYYPRLTPDTPNNLEQIRASFEGSREQFRKLLELDTPKQEKMTIVKAKWYVPLLATRIPAPRNRFEQIFYGLTVSKDTPYIGYFTAKTETIRHKFYVEDPKDKKPYLDTGLFKSWFSNTQPQRRKPTLLLYRGKSRTSFDRIAITDKDITVDVRREKDSTETLEEMKASVEKWIQSLDAVVPFLVKTDLALDRWDLNEMNVVASYSKEVTEFDMHRFPCLQTLFSFQNDVFRLLRAESTSEDLSPLEIQAVQVLTQEESERSPQYLAKELNITQEEANELFASIQSKAQDFDIEKSLRAYPVVKFTNKEVIIKFVTSLERTLEYVNILRYVLTSDSDSVNSVCPRRMEKVVAKVAIPQQEIDLMDEYNPDDELNALLGLTEDEPVPVQEETTGEEPKERKVKIGQKEKISTYNYFNTRLQKYDPDTFDKSIHPRKCDKPKQVVVLTPEDQARIGPEYNYENAEDSQKLQLQDPEGTAICPPYWCMRDEIPLREDQLVEGDDGELHCPVCDGKIQKSENADITEFTIIKRDAVAKFPDFMDVTSSINKRKIPCCYKKARSSSEVLTTKAEVSYVLDAASTNVPEKRMMFLTPELLAQLKLAAHYDKSIVKGRLISGESDIFRVGLGRPSKSLPTLLNDKTAIKRPRDAKENVIKCSFYRTWKRGTTEDEIIQSIDTAFEDGTMNMLDELEYVTTFLTCEVILIDPTTKQVLCGFWSDSVGASSRTIAVLGTTVLAQVKRTTGKTSYVCDLRKAPFKDTTLPLLRDLHARACASNLPQLSDAIKELQSKGVSKYQVVLDPFKRIQAVFVPNEILLPIKPSDTKPDMGVVVRDGYSSLRDEELPDGVKVRAFLKGALHPGFKKVNDLQDINGMIVEFQLASGFRVPIVPEEPDEGPDYAGEVTQTIRNADENTLVFGEPNKKDIQMAQTTAYAEEIYQFLMFSLSKDIQEDEYDDLRTAITNRSPELYKKLQKWFKEEAYEDSTQSPVEFVTKVRTPCGQYTDKDTCKKSSLCGWHKNDCKIRVKPIVDTTSVLKRMVKALRDNDKQRALVLDERMSPFFSTILYLEMPHEWITTTI